MNPPVFGHGELRLVLLTLIAQEPRHGYDLIHALNDHFDGDYSPSAGTIYPRLAKLQEEGLVTKTQDGRKTVYSITEAGRREVEQRREEFERITTERTDAVRTLAQSARAGLAQARRGLREELDQIAAQARTAAEEAVRREREAAEREATAAAEKIAERERAAAEAAGRARGVNPEDAKGAEAGAPEAAQAAGKPGGQAGPNVSTLFGGAGKPGTSASNASATDASTTDAPAANSDAADAPTTEARATEAQTTDAQAPDSGSASTPDQPTPTEDATDQGATNPEATDPAAAASMERASFIRRVDVALQQFRMEVRQDAREVNQLGGLDEDTVSEIETQLHETRRRLGSLLKVHR